MGKYIAGKPTQANLDKWASYANKNSFDPNHKDSHEQSKRDLDCYSNVPERDMEDPGVNTKGEGGRFYHPSDLSRRNSYTKSTRSKRGK
jgi:hypothetical protein